MLGDSQTDRDVLAVVADAAADIAADRTPQVRSQFATITSFGTADTETIPTCIVHFDGDPPGEQHEIVAALSGAPAPGDRVLVLFLPPHGAVAVAALSSPAGTGGAGGFAFMVAASDASDESKAAAHFVCEGTQDDWIINAAFYAAFQAGLSCTVELSEGTFYVTGGSPQDTTGYIAIGPGSALVGRGAGATRITWDPAAVNYTSPIVQMGYQSDLYQDSGAFADFDDAWVEFTGDHQRVAGILFDTRLAPSSPEAAIWTDYARPEAPQVIEDCVFIGTLGRIDTSDQGSVTVRRCIFDGSPSNGAAIAAAAIDPSSADSRTWQIVDCTFRNITLGGNNTALININQTDGVLVNGCLFDTITNGDCIRINLADEIVVSDCRFVSVTGSGGYTSADPSAIYINLSDNFMIRDCWGDTGDGAGVYITSAGEDTSDNGVVKDNRFASFDYGVRLVAGFQIWVDSNDLRNNTTAGFSDSGTSTVSTDNQT